MQLLSLAHPSMSVSTALDILSWGVSPARQSALQVVMLGGMQVLAGRSTHHSLADLAGCLLCIGHQFGRFFENGTLYDVTKDGAEGYVRKRRHPWGPAQDA